jgi:amino acid efflux transporter
MFIGTLAAIRLLPASRMRATAIVASALTSLTLVLSGVYLVVPAVIAVVGFTAKAIHSRKAGGSRPLSCGSRGVRTRRWAALTSEPGFEHAPQPAPPTGGARD